MSEPRYLSLGVSTARVGTIKTYQIAKPFLKSSKAKSKILGTFHDWWCPKPVSIWPNCRAVARERGSFHSKSFTFLVVSKSYN